MSIDNFRNKIAEMTEEKSVTRSEITEAMTEILADMPSKVVATGTKVIFDILEDNLVLGNRIEIRGFGSWSIRYLPPRNAHNPRSGEKVTTLGKFRTYFKAGDNLKKRVNKLINNEQQETLSNIKTTISETETIS